MNQSQEKHRNIKRGTMIKLLCDLQDVDAQITALIADHPDRKGTDWNPWDTNDHPLAIEHWILLRKRFALKSQIRNHGRSQAGRRNAEERNRLGKNASGDLSMKLTGS